MPKNIVVIGAGVSGLTTAYLLCKKNPEYDVTIVAKHVPGDYDVEYTSPWAGANFTPMTDETNNFYEKNTWPELYRLATEVPEAGIHLQKSIHYTRPKDSTTPTGLWFRSLSLPNPWFSTILPNYSVLPPSSLPTSPPDIASGATYTSLCINTALYLPYLLSQCLASRPHPVILKRHVLSHVVDAAGLHSSGQKADVVVNCTGLGAATLAGVQDATMYPIRGQIVIVRNSAKGVMMSVSGTEDGGEEICYVMERAGGGGTVLGGTYQKGNADGRVDRGESERIMRRAVELCPGLVEGMGTGKQGVEGLSVVREGVGLRPGREGGVRIERERIGGVEVVHDYGHGGWGYQGSYACSQKVVELVEEALREKETEKEKAAAA